MYVSEKSTLQVYKGGSSDQPIGLHHYIINWLINYNCCRRHCWWCEGEWWVNWGIQVSKKNQRRKEDDSMNEWWCDHDSCDVYGCVGELRAIFQIFWALIRINHDAWQSHSMMSLYHKRCDIWIQKVVQWELVVGFRLHWLMRMKRRAHRPAREVHWW